MIASLLFGAIAGLGVFAVVRLLQRQRPGVEALIARIDAGTRSMSTATISPLDLARAGGAPAKPSLQDKLGDRLEVLAAERGWRLRRVQSDLALMNRTVGAFLASKIIAGVGLFVLAPVLWAIVRLVGVPLSPAAPVVVALALGALGFFLPDLVLRSEAADRRREFRRIVAVFLDLVAMNLAGGRGLPEALLSASTISEHWAIVRLRQVLANARLFGTTPWAALGDLGRDIDVEEIKDLSGALALAADDGAKIRQSLSARAAGMRRRELSDSEGEAGEKSQSMLVAQLVICAAFMVFLGYPAVSSLLAQ